jgi:hypothetical protein
MRSHAHTAPTESRIAVPYIINGGFPSRSVLGLATHPLSAGAGEMDGSRNLAESGRQRTTNGGRETALLLTQATPAELALMARRAKEKRRLTAKAHNACEGGERCGAGGGEMHMRRTGRSRACSSNGNVPRPRGESRERSGAERSGAEHRSSPPRQAAVKAGGWPREPDDTQTQSKMECDAGGADPDPQ